MIIWGSRGRTSVMGSCEFNCPQCAEPKAGDRVQVRTFFTLYFIPLFPVGTQGTYVECGTCKGTYSEDILAYDPAEEQAETNSQILRIMILAALADQAIDEAELAEIKKQYLEITGLPVTEATLNEEIRLAREADINLNIYVSSIAKGMEPHGKAFVVETAFKIISAASEIQPSHQEQLSKLGDTLDIPQDQYVELIKHLRESADAVT